MINVISVTECNRQSKVHICKIATVFAGKDTPFERIYLRVNELSETFLKVTLIMMQIMYVVMSVVFIAVGALYYGIHDGHIEAGNLYTPLRIM